MPSTKRIEPIDVPVQTPQEADALATARRLNTMTPDEFLDFLTEFAKQHPPSRNSDEPWPEPFEL